MLGDGDNLAILHTQNLDELNSTTEQNRNSSINPVLRALIELLSGLALAYILAFLPNLVLGGDGNDLAGSFFQIYLGLIAGVIITGEWMRGNRIWTKRLRKAVLWAIFGLALGIAVHIFIIYTWRDQMPFMITAYILPYAIPALTILLGYEVMPGLKQNKD